MSQTVVVLSQAAEDIEFVIDFTSRSNPESVTTSGISILSDIQRLGPYFGQHAIRFGFNRAVSERFPFAIYYRERGTLRQVVAVLDMRRDPAWSKRQLESR